MAETREAIAEVLTEHEADVTSYDAGDIHGRRRGWDLTGEQQRSEDYGWGAYRHHLADALAPLIARMVAEAEQRGFERGVNATFDTDGALVEAGRRADGFTSGWHAGWAAVSAAAGALADLGVREQWPMDEWRAGLRALADPSAAVARIKAEAWGEGYEADEIGNDA